MLDHVESSVLEDVESWESDDPLLVALRLLELSSQLLLVLLLSAKDCRSWRSGCISHGKEGRGNEMVSICLVGKAIKVKCDQHCA